MDAAIAGLESGFLTPLQNLVLTIAHETAHATLPGGMPPVYSSYSNPKDYADMAVRCEGIAQYSEYMAAKELGYTDAGTYPHDLFDLIAETHGTDFDFIMAGAQRYAKERPSTAENLFYDQYYEAQFAAYNLGISIDSNAWKTLSGDDIRYTVNADGAWSGGLANVANSDAQKFSVWGDFSSTGKMERKTTLTELSGGEYAVVFRAASSSSEPNRIYTLTGVGSMPTFQGDGTARIMTAEGAFSLDARTGVISVSGPSYAVKMDNGAAFTFDRSNGFAVVVKEGRVETVKANAVGADGTIPADFSGYLVLLPDGGFMLAEYPEGSTTTGLTVVHENGATSHQQQNEGFTHVERDPSDSSKVILTNPQGVKRTAYVNPTTHEAMEMVSRIIAAAQTPHQPANLPSLIVVEVLSFGEGASTVVSRSETYDVADSWSFTNTTNYGANGASTSSSSTQGTLSNYKDFLSVDYSLHWASNAGWLSDTWYNGYTNWSSSYLLGLGSGSSSSNWTCSAWDPIGAFYESSSPGYDPAPSIASDTPRLLNAAGQGLTEYGLSTYDTNADTMLSGGELTNLRAWIDGNENGVAETGEIKTLAEAGIDEIRQINYLYYTAGNSVACAAPLVAPTKASEAVTLSRVDRIPTVPASTFRSLRDGDNLYLVGGLYISWASTQIKINYNNKSYLIGTDGNDAFDATYYASYDGTYFNLSLLTNFLGGGGDDTVGGSSRSDSIWGGTGGDYLLGYAGDDRLYGEEGNDELHGQDGNDTLDGGDGNDRMFGQVGDDVLHGGAGVDLLVGFTASNEAKQSLNAGETDNDWLYGGAGNDAVFGGTGNDQIQGNEGDDRLSGEDGNDRIFGQVGNDTIWGGNGDDVIVGFTASNEAKQTLGTGETDADTLYGGIGNDDIYGGFGDDTLDGGVGNDLLLGDQGNDTLFGGVGDDELQGSSGNDRLIGEAGNDNLFGQVGDDVLWGGDGDDMMMGFTALNEAKQALLAGESDNDTLYGGAGNDLMLGGLGQDTLLGETGVDELQGGAGNDLLYGGDGNDRLFGQVGNDALYGGAGDDILVGFTGSNEAKQTLLSGESDNDWLYGGAGNDILLGGLGYDYLDGGAGADIMEGGQGDDIYVVNSVNDTILEQANEGYDMVVSSANYLLNANVEELRLLEGYDIHGTGNSLNNLLIGNSGNNILDGVTGADMMIGAAGDDTYYVDNAGDRTVELAGEGSDTVQSSISHILADNVENLILLDFSKPEKGLVDGEAALVYGYPKANELDYMQGDAVPDFWGTCALTSIANLLTQAARPTTESDVIERAIEHGWAVTDPKLPPYVRGGSNYVDQQALLDSYGVRNGLIAGYNEDGVANLVRSGRGVMIAVNAGKLWGDAAYVDGGGVNHVVTVTGVVYGEGTNELLGFYIADSGRHKVSDMTRFVGVEAFRAAAEVPNAYAIYTKETLKLWSECIDGTGNALDNVLTGNRNNNVLSGLAGNDILQGGAGDDTLIGGSGSDTYVFNQGDGNDTIVNGTGVGAGPSGRLSLGDGVGYDTLWLSRAQNDLVVERMGSSDRVVVQGWYDASRPDAQLSGIETAAGFTLDTQLDGLVQAMATYTADHAGFDPTIAANTSITDPTVLAAANASWHRAAA